MKEDWHAAPLQHANPLFTTATYLISKPFYGATVLLLLLHQNRSK
jgi:hypothetical protein